MPKTIVGENDYNGGLPISNAERAVFMLACSSFPSVLEAVCSSSPEVSKVFQSYTTITTAEGEKPKVEDLLWGFCFNQVNDLVAFVQKNKAAYTATANAMDDLCNDPPFCPIQFHSEVLPLLLPNIMNALRCL